MHRLSGLSSLALLPAVLAASPFALTLVVRLKGREHTEPSKPRLAQHPRQGQQPDRVAPTPAGGSGPPAGMWAAAGRGNIRGNVQIVHYVHIVHAAGRSGRYGRIGRITDMTHGLSIMQERGATSRRVPPIRPKQLSGTPDSRCRELEQSRCPWRAAESLGVVAPMSFPRTGRSQS